MPRPDIELCFFLAPHMRDLKALSKTTLKPSAAPDSIPAAHDEFREKADEEYDTYLSEGVILPASGV